MSNLILNRVWGDTTIGSARARLALVSLADQANDDGICWPGYGSISGRMACSKPTAIKSIEALERSGAIEVYQSSNGSDTNHYLIKIGMTEEQYTAARQRLAKLGMTEPRTVKAEKDGPKTQFVKNFTGKDGFTTPGKDGFTGGVKAGLPGVVKAGLPDPLYNPHLTQNNNLSSPDGETPANSDERPSDLKCLEMAFSQLSGLNAPAPPRTVKAAQLKKWQKQTAVRWWQPLRRILGEANGDFEMARTALAEAISSARQDRLTIAAPQSVEKSAVSFVGLMKANGSRTPENSTGGFDHTALLVF